MQFLRQQRNGRKRKTYLERVGLVDRIKSAEKFYENYNLLENLKGGGQGQIYSIECKSIHNNGDEKKAEIMMEGNETKKFPETDDVGLFVVKIISFSGFDNENIKIELESAINEYELLTKLQLLNHKDIYYDENKKELLIMTEYLESNLSELKHSIIVKDDKNDLIEDNIKEIMCDILNKLNILHLSGYIHCDLTPDNIMNDKNGQFKLIDFDMMSKIDLKRGYIKDCFKGTIGWTSFEIGHNIDSSNNKYSFATDLWSFGLLILYIINDFKNPFELTNDEILKNELNDEQTRLEYYYKYKMTLDKLNEIQILLITWFASDKISFYLYDLLINHLLVFDVNDRCKTCKHLSKHPWFYGYIKKNQYKYQSFDMISI